MERRLHVASCDSIPSLITVFSFRDSKGTPLTSLYFTLDLVHVLQKGHFSPIGFYIGVCRSKR